MAGSQSSDWFWLPPITRSATTGSLTDAALPRLALMPIRTTMLWVQLVCTELQRSTALAHWMPFSQTWATWIGPERALVAPNARCTVPNDPMHLLPLPVLQVLPCSLPLVSSQSTRTSEGPAPTGSVSAAEFQSFEAAV